MNWKKTLEILLFLVNVLIIVVFWNVNSGKMLFSGSSDFFIGIGRLAGLLGVYFVLMQLVFIGRILWVERLFGLDNLSRIHKWNGYFALSLLVLHPIFLAIGYGIENNLNVIAQLINFVLYFPNVLLAAIALFLLIIIVFMSISIVRNKIKYEYWYFVHLFTYLAILLAFFHQIKIGGDFVNNPFFTAYWYFLYIFIIGNFVLFRFLRPLFIFTKHSFFVEKIVMENDKVTSVYIGGRNIDKFKIKAGQFMILRFLCKGLWWQAHPFSLSFSPNGKKLRVSIKNVGDFTSKISLIEKGTKVYVDGPYGTFTDNETIKKIVLIASGIGITPIYSLLESLAGKKDIILLYGCKTKDDFVFKKDIDFITKKNKIKAFYFTSQEKISGFKEGRITKEIIKELIPDFKERDFFICGPITMIKDLKKDLLEIGVKKIKIHFERFSL